MKLEFLIIHAFLIFLISISFAPYSSGQSQQDVIDFESKNWIVDDPEAKVMRYMDRESLYLFRGIAFLRDVEFENGMIEVDIACHGHRGFAGIVFRLQSPKDYELVYLRPHKSGLPDAIQYTPVFNGLLGWQLYSSEGYTAASDIPLNRWTHVKILVSDRNAYVYLNGADKPSLIVNDLKRGMNKGSIGLWGLNGVANFTNFRYELSTGADHDIQASPSLPPAGIIDRWTLSEAFNAQEFSKDELPTTSKANAMRWLDVESESTGLVNVSRFRSKVTPIQRSPTRNQKDVVFARSIVYSQRDQTRKMSFGYSDEISIFLNGKILFQGNSAFRSRDPGFLGIVGVDNDALYLNLKKGENELVLAVRETFGGWGFVCRLDDTNGIEIR